MRRFEQVGDFEIAWEMTAIEDALCLESVLFCCSSGGSENEEAATFVCA